MDSQRGLVHRIERKLESAVEDAVARVFGGHVLPEEVEAALRREAAEQVRSLAGNQLLAPNDYVITLSEDDYNNVGADQDLTAKAFARHLEGYVGEQGWQTYGDVVVRFQPSSSLHTGQVRARGWVNPDPHSPAGSNAPGGPHQTVDESRPPQSVHAFNAESGVPQMTDNPSYRGAYGQDRPGDDYYDPRHGRPADGPDPRGHYAPPADPYQQERGYQDPNQGSPGAYAPPRRPEQGGYPGQPGQPPYPGQPGQPGGYPGAYEQRPPSGYGAPTGYEQPYPSPQAPQYQPPAPGYPGGQPGYGEYERPAGRPDDHGYPGSPYEQPQAYPDQGGYDHGAPSYGRQDYNQPGYGYAEAPQGQPSPAGYDYGQQAGAGYSEQPGGGYGQRSYNAPAAVTLQLDDGSGRTYQLHEGSNVVGRGQDAQFRLPDTGVSRRHLEIRWDGRVALLSDLNSTNGTTVNNAPVQEWQLADGDVIRLGHSEIIVRVH